MKANLVWPPVMKGRYRHSKSGQIYRVLGGAKHSETLEDLVVYQAENEPFRIWVRPISMFFDEVELEGKKTPRFELIV